MAVCAGRASRNLSALVKISLKLFGQMSGRFVRGRPTDPQVPMLSTTISMVRDRGTQDPGLPLWSRTKPRRGNRVD